jgi:hypothetical protein
MWPAAAASGAGAPLSAGFRQSSSSASGWFPPGTVTGRELVPAGLAEGPAAGAAVSGVDPGSFVCAGFGAAAAATSSGAASMAWSVTVNATFDGCSGSASPTASDGGSETAAAVDATAECCGAGRADGSVDGLEGAGAGGAAAASLPGDTGAG